ncbi:MAG: acetylornithine/N-succinyldiaminopimelate aminotransferase [Myxococcota bacterium]|jgi:acetylornithine/N-succinyldiaminopimelate aminotransferase
MTAAATTGHAGATARAATRIMNTYGSPDLSFVRGEGAALFDHEGRPYLDLLCGLAVTSLGHAHPAVTAAVTKQVSTLVHTSNLHLTEPALELAERLARITGWDDARTFFAQCGATANEAAIKLARRHGLAQHPGKVRVVTLEGSFHGRTFATLEATGQPDKHERFQPLMGYVDTVAFDDPDALRAAVTGDTCAVLLEPVQGEGGVRPVPDAVLLAAREACDAVGALLIFDEVQTGIGRTGTWFAFQQTPVVPDVVTSAKALANGLPIGACIAHGAAAATFVPGDHATTFGGNPVTSAAACAVLDTIEHEGLLARTQTLSAAFVRGIDALAAVQPLVAGVRGRGLLLGIELTRPVAAAVADACRARFLLVNAVGPSTVRLAPPLILTDAEVELALAGITDAIVAVAADLES